MSPEIKATLDLEEVVRGLEELDILLTLLGDEETRRTAEQEIRRYFKPIVEDRKE